MSLNLMMSRISNEYVLVWVTFMSKLCSFRVLVGMTPEYANFVQCVGGVIARADMNRGIVNVAVGIAPVKPAVKIYLVVEHPAPKWSSAGPCSQLFGG